MSLFQTRRFRIIVTVWLCVQSLFVLGVVDRFTYNSSSLQFLYGTPTREWVEMEVDGVIRYQTVWHYSVGQIVYDVSTLVLFGGLVYAFFRYVHSKAARVIVYSLAGLLVVIGALNAKVNGVKSHYTGRWYGLPEEVIADPREDLSPLATLVYEPGRIAVLGIPIPRHRNYLGYEDFAYYGRSELNRFVPQDFLEYQRLLGFTPMHIQYFTWQYPGYELAMYDLERGRYLLIGFDNLVSGIESFLGDLISRYDNPFHQYRALFRRAFASEFYTEAFVDDPYFLIEQGRYEEATRSIESAPEEVQQFLRDKLAASFVPAADYEQAIAEIEANLSRYRRVDSQYGPEGADVGLSIITYFDENDRLAIAYGYLFESLSRTAVTIYPIHENQYYVVWRVRDLSAPFNFPDSQVINDVTTEYLVDGSRVFTIGHIGERHLVRSQYIRDDVMSIMVHLEELTGNEDRLGSTTD